MQEYMVFWQAAGALFFAPPSFLALAFPRARLLHQASPVFSFPHSKLLPFQILPLKRWPRRLDYKATLNLHNQKFSPMHVRRIVFPLCDLQLVFVFEQTRTHFPIFFSNVSI